MARFCSSDYVLKSINGIKIKKVIRVTNRVLLAKYEENVLYEIDENDYINNRQFLLFDLISYFQAKVKFYSRPTLKKKIDYLMYCWRPKFGTQLEELHDIIRSGFKSPAEYQVKFKLFLNKIDTFFTFFYDQKLGYEEGIPFTNSLSICDYQRIENFKGSSNSKHNLNFKYGNRINFSYI